MKTSKRLLSTLFVALVMTLFATMALAQDQDQNYDSDNGNDDPPGRAADIRYMTGQVSIQPGGVDDWVAAAINRPLTTADKVWTDKESRAELNLGNSALRLSSETSLTLTNVTDQDIQVELDQGTLNLSVRQLYDGEIYEVDTPNMAFTLSRAGNYRFDVDPDGDTTMVTVRNGAGEATGDGPGVSIRTGQEVSFSNGQSMQSEFSNLPRPDGFDDWCRVRDDRELNSQSAQYVSPDVVGAADLDENGVWSEVPEYGHVWRPSHVDADWAPYHDGHWLWVEPWGWTWVDDAPWGFAPSHYGRWVYTGGYWGWTPGPRVVNVRPVYAPALVAFVGGSNWGVGVSFGGGAGVGWFPLGYNEPYIPPYHTSRNYFTQVNVTNIHVTNVTVINNYYNNRTQVNNIRYVNRTQPRAFVAVSASAMSSGQSVRRVAVNVPRADIERVSMVRNAPVAPVRNSVLGVHAGVRSAAPPARVMDRQVVRKTAPPPRPIPFAAKQDALAKNPGRPLNRQNAQQIRATLPPPPPAANRGGNNNRGNNNTAIPNTHIAPPQPGTPANPNGPRNPGNVNPGNDNRPANVGNRDDRNQNDRNPNDRNQNDRNNVPRPNNGNLNPRQPAGNDNNNVQRPGGADSNPNIRPNPTQPDRAQPDRPQPGNRNRPDLTPDNNRDNNDAAPRNNNPNTPSANQPRNVPRPPNADRGPRQTNPPDSVERNDPSQRNVPPGQDRQPSRPNNGANDRTPAPDRATPTRQQPRDPDTTDRRVPPQRDVPPAQDRQVPRPNAGANDRPRQTPPDRDSAPQPQRPPNNMNRPAPPAQRDAPTPNREVAPERSVPKPPPAKPDKDEKPKDHDKDNKPR